jgi:hypothetical protein
MPAKAGIQYYLKTPDSRFRGNDVKGRFKAIYKTIDNNLSKSLYEAISLNRQTTLFIFKRRK